MSKLFYRAFIEDIENQKCTDLELEQLIDIFQYSVKHMATTLARKSWFELKDYYDAKKRGIANFTLEIEKKTIKGVDNFIGEFKSNNKNLKIIATLHKN